MTQDATTVDSTPAQEATLHSHRCLRCGGVFTCRTPVLCAAQYDVLPRIVTLDAHGAPQVADHCPPDTTPSSHRSLTNAVDGVLRDAGESDFTDPERYNAMVERVVIAALFAREAKP